MNLLAWFLFLSLLMLVATGCICAEVKEVKRP